MATVKADRPLMRQKINVTPALIAKWEYEYKFDIRNLINPSLLKVEDLGTTFEHQGRTFQIVGMGEGRNVMLKEITEQGEFYWESSRQFVQMKLNRFNKIYQKLPTGKTALVNIEYDLNQLHLAPKSNRRKKVKTEEEEIEEVENEFDLNDDTETNTQTDIVNEETNDFE